MAGFPARGAKDPVEELSGRQGAGGDTVPDDLVTVDRLVVGVLTPHASAGRRSSCPP